MSRCETDDYPTASEIRGQAERARERGLVLAVERNGARVDHVVCDPRDGSSHYVTAFSCSCRQFVQGGGCCHHWALLLDSLGWIPSDAATDARLAAAS